MEAEAYSLVFLYTEGIANLIASLLNIDAEMEHQVIQPLQTLGILISWMRRLRSHSDAEQIHLHPKFLRFRVEKYPALVFFEWLGKANVPSSNILEDFGSL